MRIRCVFNLAAVLNMRRKGIGKGRKRKRKRQRPWNVQAGAWREYYQIEPLLYVESDFKHAKEPGLGAEQRVGKNVRLEHGISCVNTVISFQQAEVFQLTA